MSLYKFLSFYAVSVGPIEISTWPFVGQARALGSAQRDQHGDLGALESISCRLRSPKPPGGPRHQIYRKQKQRNKNSI